MTWHKETNGDGKVVAVWSEAYPGHHEIEMRFNLQELKEQLGLESSAPTW